MKLRIAICAPYDLSRDGGVNSHIRSQARALSGLGHVVRVFGAASRPLTNGERSVSGCISPVIGGTETGVGVDPRAWYRVGRLYDDVPFDVIHVHEPLMPLVPWCAILRARAPIVATFHANREHGHRFYASYRAFLVPLMARVALRIAVSASAERTVKRYFPGDYTVIPNGIDTARFREERRRPSSMPDDRRHVLYVGRLEPRKGVEHLVDAMAIVQRDVPDARLVIVGDGPDREALRARTRDAHVDAHFAGRVCDAELPLYYCAADVVCSPAVGGESFGIVLLEAMAAARAVVATDIEGYRELIAGAPDTARLVTRSDPRALATEIGALLRDPSLRRRLGSVGPSFAERFDWTAIARRLEARYVALVRNGVAVCAS